MSFDDAKLNLFPKVSNKLAILMRNIINDTLGNFSIISHAFITLISEHTFVSYL